ncbi:uroporphyrinogen decarboxylase family protein [Dorea sp. AM58-8]|uniref:uroporphyrinogen decarboxylase family protein n=1 Tax=Dorea sp. AM58-8 TaxID=2292346 RepID=UPI001314AB14
MKKHYGDSLPVGVSVARPLSTAASIREPESILKDMRKNKDNLHKLLAFSTSCALTWIETCKKEFGKVSAGIADPVSFSTIISLIVFVNFRSLI